MEENNIKALMDEIREQNEQERRYLKKQLDMMKALAFAMAGIFLMLLIAVAFLVPKITITLRKADVALENITYTAEQIDDVFDSAKQLLENSSEGVAQALENMNSIDFETLNRSIDDFNKVVSPLSDFFGRFK